MKMYHATPDMIVQYLLVVLMGHPLRASSKKDRNLQRALRNL
jgi:hypothetical protein